MGMTPNCMTCKNAIFSPTWGEYKCKEQELIIYNPAGASDCEDYVKGEPGITQNIEEAE